MKIYHTNNLSENGVDRYVSLIALDRSYDIQLIGSHQKLKKIFVELLYKCTSEPSGCYEI